MGKSKRKQEQQEEEDTDCVADKRLVYEMVPEERAKWFSTACRLTDQGTFKVGVLYDVLSNPKICSDLPDKIGMRMCRTLTKYMYLFSPKQKRYLEQTPLATFNKEMQEPGEQKQRHRTAGHVAGGEDAAAAMEEMMARCRNFVREKASTYEEREREAREKVEEEERLRVEAEERERRQQEENLRAWEWEQIALWHNAFEPWETQQMMEQDFRKTQRDREMEAANEQMARRTEAEEAARIEREKEEAEARAIREKERAEERERERESRRLEELSRARDRFLQQERERNAEDLLRERRRDEIRRASEEISAKRRRRWDSQT